MVKTNHYFMKHGGKTILMARFVPFVRSFAPFAAGSARMNIAVFTFYNVVGGLIWLGLLLGIGYGLGHTVSTVVDLV